MLFNKNLYFLSEDPKMDNAVLKPRIPKNFMTDNYYENTTIPRVCFAPSIDKALIALSVNCKGKKFYVYKPDLSNAKIYHPNKSLVPDVGITKEVWVLNEVRIHYVGMIKVGEALKGYKYKYGGGKEATLWSWSWEWVERKEN